MHGAGNGGNTAATLGQAPQAQTKQSHNNNVSIGPSTSSYSRQRQAPFPTTVPSWRRKKPLWVVQQEIHASQNNSNSNHCTIQRHLTLWDLVSVGVGGTIGSGIFVLAGLIAHHHAGRATWMSFAIAGLAAAASGVCYAELSGRIPCAGSTYVYAYVCWGEVAAVIAAACLTLEYGVSGAAVARSWGDKLVAYVVAHHGNDGSDSDNDSTNLQGWLEPHGINLMAGLVSSVSVLLLLAGIQESKRVTNFFTLAKVALVLFMTIGGFCLHQSTSSLMSTSATTQPFAPYGAAGIWRGATSSFFGYLGYDEVCCIAGEALHPHRDMPRAVLWTLAIVTVLYILASIALTGMLPYDQISDTSGFPAAFRDRNVHWAATIAALGEIVTLPVVVLISLMAQPRLQLAMAHDGLLPPLFAQVDDKGNLKWGTAISGILMVLVATFVPFTYLDDLISVGILLAFSMTNSCLILLRCESPVAQTAERHLLVYNGLCLVTGLLLAHTSAGMSVWTGISCLATVSVVVSLTRTCPPSATFGGSIVRANRSDPNLHEPSLGNDNDDTAYFSTPLVPYLPCAGIFINWCLVAQLELSGLLLLLVYVGGSVALYLFVCTTHGSSSGAWGWRKRASYQSLSGLEDDDDHWPSLQRELSMPPMQMAQEHPASTVTATTATLNRSEHSLTEQRR